MRRILLAIMLLIPSFVWADPSITSWNGSPSHGGTITITGINFGTKSPARPLFWAPFDSGTMSRDTNLSAISDVRFDDVEYASNATSGEQAHQNSTGLVRCQLNDSDNYPLSPQQSCTVSGHTSDYVGWERLYSFSRRKYETDSLTDYMTQADSNLKTIRWYPCSGDAKCLSIYGSTDYMVNFIVGFFNVDAGDPYANGKYNFSMEGTGYSVPKAWDGTNPPSGEWYTEELEFKHGTTDNWDGRFRHWINSRIHNDAYPITRTTNHGGNERTIHDFFFQNHWAWGGTPLRATFRQDAWVYMDDLYLDNTLSRVMIGNNATFANCTHREPLIPTAWSSTSITAYFNQGSFANGSQAYLFVVDSNGVASLGRQITISGTPPPDTTPTEFTLVDITGVSLSTQYTSNSITVSGLGTATGISISGNSGQYSKNSGAWTSLSGTVVNGDTVRVRQTSSSLPATMVITTLNIGGVTEDYTVTTTAGPILVTPVGTEASGWPVDFVWQVYAGAVGYWIQVDNSLDFGSPEINDLSINPATACDLSVCHYYVAYGEGLLPGVPYYWRVRPRLN